MRVHLRITVIWLIGLSGITLLMLGMIPRQEELILRQKHMVPWGPDFDEGQQQNAVHMDNNYTQHLQNTLRPVQLKPLKRTFMRTGNRTQLNELKERLIKFDNLAELFPDPTETEDRVVEQMNLVTNVERQKVILVWNGVGKDDVGNKRFVSDKCPMTNCSLTGDKQSADSVDAILFNHNVPPNVKTALNHNQIRILSIPGPAPR